MSMLPKQKTDIAALIDVGYTVTYTNSKDDIEGCVDLHDCTKETVTKNGVICAPANEPAVKYRDKKSGQIVGAAWYNENGQLDRKNAPAFVCERSNETGAAGGAQRTKYVVLAHYKNGVLHNDNGAALTCDDMNDAGQMIRSIEKYSIEGKTYKYARRDEKGNINPDHSSHHFLEKDMPLERDTPQP